MPKFDEVVEIIKLLDAALLWIQAPQVQKKILKKLPASDSVFTSQLLIQHAFSSMTNYKFAQATQEDFTSFAQLLMSHLEKEHLIYPHDDNPTTRVFYHWLHDLSQTCDKISLSLISHYLSDPSDEHRSQLRMHLIKTTTNTTDLLNTCVKQSIPFSRVKNASIRWEKLFDKSEPSNTIATTQERNEEQELSEFNPIKPQLKINVTTTHTLAPALTIETKAHATQAQALTTETMTHKRLVPTLTTKARAQGSCNPSPMTRTVANETLAPPRTTHASTHTALTQPLTIETNTCVLDDFTSADILSTLPPTERQDVLQSILDETKQRNSHNRRRSDFLNVQLQDVSSPKTTATIPLSEMDSSAENGLITVPLDNPPPVRNEAAEKLAIIRTLINDTPWWYQKVTVGGTDPKIPGMPTTMPKHIAYIRSIVYARATDKQKLDAIQRIGTNVTAPLPSPNKCNFFPSFSIRKPETQAIYNIFALISELSVEQLERKLNLARSGNWQQLR